MAKRDYYEILGIAKGADDKEIKSAYRRLAKKYHPDVSTESDAEAKFKEIQEAYAVLSEPEQRARYDQYGHEGINFNGGGFQGFEGFGGFEDIFSSFFGGGGQQRRRDPNAPMRGADIQKRMTIDFMDAIKGIKKKIKLDVSEQCHTCHGSGAHSKADIGVCSHCNGQGVVYRTAQTIFGQTRTQQTCPYCQGSGKEIKRKCDTCHGDGYVTKEITVDVTIPAGINTNQQIRLSEKGEPGVNGGPNGDLYIVINVRPHDVFERHDNDIVMELPISFSQAALGADVETPTVHGKVNLKIPAGTQTGSRFRLRGKGVKSVNSSYTGDQHVIVKVITPEKLDSEQKKLFKKLSTTDEMSSSLWKKFTTIFND